MTTTIEQKAGILVRWALHRAERNLEADVAKQACFNWPSLSNVELEELLSVTKRRLEMKAAKHVIRCDLGQRLYIEKFDDTNAAKVFLDRLLGKDKLKWESSTVATAKKGELRVSCEELEDIIEFKPRKKTEYTLPKQTADQIEAFLHGHWKHLQESDKEAKANDDDADELNDTKRKKTASRAPRRSQDGNADVRTLAQLCEKIGIAPREARMAMREAKWEKPGASWEWPVAKAAQIEKQLRQLMKSTEKE